MQESDLLKRLHAAEARISELEQTLLDSKQSAHSMETAFLSGLNNSPEATILIEHKTGTIVDINEAFLVLTGYTRKDILGRTSKDLKLWSSPAKRIHLLRTLKENHSCNNLRASFKVKSGETHIGIISAHHIHLNDSLYILCFIRDITGAEKQQKQITNQLEQTSRLLEAIFNSIPDILGIQDRDHKIIRYNEAGYKLLNVTAEEARGKKCYELIGQKKPCGLCATSETYQTKKPAQIQKYLPDSDVWFDVRSYPILNEQNEIELVIEHLRDITTEKKASEAIKESAERLELALKGADLGMWDWDLRTNELTHSERWCTMLGYHTDDIGSDFSAWKSLVHPDDYDMVMDTLQTHLDGKTAFYETEHRMKNKSGEWVWILDRGRIVERNPDGKVLRMAGTHLDITYRKNAEEENKRLQEQLSQAQKMEAVGTLAGGIAHDFNNLLTVINGYSEIALLKMEENSPSFKDVEAIQAAGQRAESLTRQLLAFSRKQIFTPKIINLNKVIINLDKMLYRLIGEDISIAFELDDTIPLVKADPGQIEQILINLIINARDAINQQTDCASEKKISVETRFKYLDETYLSKNVYSKYGPHVVLVVSDNGIGIRSSEVKDKIFEPFFTTKERAKGTGLGLATVYGIIKQNNGHITVYSEPGNGTTFNIYWPACFESNCTEGVSPQKHKKLKGHETILLVEDDKAVREFALSALENFGYDIIVAVNGRDALRILEDREHPDIDLMITDLIMPEMNGHELAEKFRTYYPDVQVLFTSGYPENHIVRNGHLEKGINFLQKPYSPGALAEKIRNILDQY